MFISPSTARPLPCGVFTELNIPLGHSPRLGCGAADSGFEIRSPQNNDDAPSYTDCKSQLIGICKGALKTCMYACEKIISGISYVITRFLGWVPYRNNHMSLHEDLKTKQRKGEEILITHQTSETSLRLDQPQSRQLRRQNRFKREESLHRKSKSVT